MTIKIKQYTFEGPYASASYLKDQSGVYVILGNNRTDKLHVIDVGKSCQLRTRIENHDRRTCWERQNFTTLSVAALYANENSCVTIESELRNHFNPPCGQR